MGLAPGDRVLWLGKNNDGFARIVAGVARARMVLVPINWRLTRPEVRFIAEDSGAALALVSDAFLADCTAALDGAVKVLPADSTDWIAGLRSEEHTSELQSLMRISYAVFCLKQ